jgi:hypothetical protein
MAESTYYTSDKPCKKCENTLRYVNGKHCVVGKVNDSKDLLKNMISYLELNGDKS